MLLIDAKESQYIDKMTIFEHGIPGIILMEDAGFSLAKAAAQNCSFKDYVIVCGKGKNGGDGFVAARILDSMGKNVTIIMLCSPDKLREEAETSFAMAKMMGIRYEIGLTAYALKKIKNADCIIDCIFGTGFKNEPRDIYKRAIKTINLAEKFVVSCDIPSGIDSTTGKIYNECIKADITVTFGLKKIGMALYPANEYCGKVIVESISFAKDVINKCNIKTSSVENIQMPSISDGDHKGTRGRTVIIAGSEKYTGAPFLCSYSALKSGSGLTYLFVPDCIHNILASKLTEVIVNKFPSENGTFSKKAAKDISEQINNADSVVLGCGLSNTPDTSYIVSEVLKKCKVPVILDADGINSITDKTILKKRKYKTVITPHIGEMARFLEIKPEKIIENPISIAQKTAMEYNITIVLKSANTIIAYPDGKIMINTYANAGLATAGSGDVLAGIIGSFISQGMDVFKAAYCGVGFHSMAGKIASQKCGKHCMSACDIIKFFGNVEERLKNEQFI